MRFWISLLVLLAFDVRAQEVSHAPHDPFALYGDELTFDIYRKGARIGGYQAKFSRAENSLVIASKMDIAVKIAFIVAYRYHYDAVEVWSAGKLWAIDSNVNDDGNQASIAARTEDGVIKVTGGTKGPVTAPTSIVPTTHWNPDQPHAPQTLDTLKGLLREGPATKLGVDTITIAGKQVEAEHYRYLGDLRNSEVWYAKGRWVHMQFISKKDGSLVEFRCVKCGI